jgi:hypothetical protein
MHRRRCDHLVGRGEQATTEIQIHGNTALGLVVVAQPRSICSGETEDVKLARSKKFRLVRAVRFLSRVQRPPWSSSRFPPICSSNDFSCCSCSPPNVFPNGIMGPLPLGDDHALCEGSPRNRFSHSTPDHGEPEKRFARYFGREALTTKAWADHSC